MGDAVEPLSGGLVEGETMRVFERAVDLGDGVTVWLRRWVPGDQPGVREWLEEGRWVASRGDVHRLYVRSIGLRGYEWAYRAPEAFDSWEEALAAARVAEANDQRTVRNALAAAGRRAS